MEHYSNQMANDLRAAAKQATDGFRKIADSLNVVTKEEMKKGIEKMTKEDALKFSNFVKGGGLEAVIEQVKQQMSK